MKNEKHNNIWMYDFSTKSKKEIEDPIFSWVS
jgi:hypothetical protein